VSPVADGRPVPAVAYERWLDALTRAGWSGRADTDADAERVGVGQALGRVTAEPVTARWPSPRGACAAMDGIAVRAADLAAAVGGGDGDGDCDGDCDGDPSSRAAAEAGTVTLAAGTFTWIDTGDPMPAGADTVVVRERLRTQADGRVQVVPAAGDPAAGHASPAAVKRNVRAAGEDFQAGEVLVAAGRRLRPGDLAAAEAGGHPAIAVRRQAAVAIIPTGDEIRPVGSALHPGDIMDTNSLMLAARCRQLGALPQVSPVVPDDPDLLTAEVRRVAGRADLILVIAGSSRGRGDHTAAVLAQVGGLAVTGVALRPGHPALLGHAKRPGHGTPASRQAGVAPVIGLPGYPLASAVVFELFAAPLLSALGGQEPAPKRLSARLDRDWDSPAGVEEWVLVTLGPPGPDGLPAASPGRRGAGSISLLARADAWWPVPAGQDRFRAGTAVRVMPIPGS
jgi:putative molybdopterin biosynthesis protein